MPKLVLTHGYFLQEDPKELQIMKPYVPLGILYICSHLRAKGIHVEVFDTTFSTRPELFSYLQSETPAILGVYANLMTRKNVVEILRVAHEAGWKTIVGGPEPGAYVDEYLRAGADVVVLGEGELTMEELVPLLGASHDLSRVAGIAYLDEHNQVQRTAPRAQITNLDAQPWPARDTVDVDRYVNTWRTAHGKGSASFITARGCPYKCRWCSHQVFGQTHRRRNPRLVVDEVEWLLTRYQPDMVWVADDVFTIHHGWLREYAAEMRKRSIHIPFECITRADRMNDEVVDLLAELGCFRVWIGSESGSQRILDSMERGVTVEQVQRGVEMARSRGIASGMFLMWGYEGEELQDIEATIEHVKRSDPDVFFTTVAYPIKGTPYYDKISSQLLQIKPWTESSDRDLVVSGRHSKRFYDYADRLLQDEVQLARFERVGELNANGTELRNRISETRAALHASYAEVEA
jgi:anaerobic magnesium-protoporphyrin IX monomethyl ester cyclase